MEFQSLALLFDTVTVTTERQKRYRLVIEDINNTDLDVIIALIPRLLIEFDPFGVRYTTRTDNVVISIVRFFV